MLLLMRGRDATTPAGDGGGLNRISTACTQARDIAAAAPPIETRRHGRRWVAPRPVSPSSR